MLHFHPDIEKVITSRVKKNLRAENILQNNEGQVEKELVIIHYINTHLKCLLRIYSTDTSCLS